MRCFNPEKFFLMRRFNPENASLINLLQENVIFSVSRNSVSSFPPIIGVALAESMPQMNLIDMKGLDDLDSDGESVAEQPAKDFPVFLGRGWSKAGLEA